MSAIEVLIPARAVFQPVVDLDTGSVVAVEAHTGPPSGPGGHARPDPASEDVRRSVDAAMATRDLGTRLPLQISIRAETLAYGQAPLHELHQGLHDAGRRPNEVIVCVGGGFPPAQRPAVTSALLGLRRAGYLIGLSGLGAAHIPLDLLIEGQPYLVRLDGEMCRKSSTDVRRAGLISALVDMARRIGTHVQAPGLATEEQIIQLRELGVRLVQGPALAPPEWRPGMHVTVPVVAREQAPQRHRGSDLGPRVSEFTLPAVMLSTTATADDVLDTLNAETGTTSVVLVDEHQRPRNTVDRTRFLLKLSGAYGHALHAHKPATRLADPPRLVPKTVPAIAALRAAGKESDRVYDDLVVTDEIGRCIGIVRVGDLIRSLTP